MKSEIINIKTPLNHEELLTKLNSITVTDFSKSIEFPHAIYYGSLTPNSFHLKHVRYTPMSIAPSLEGEIISAMNEEIVKITIDIQSDYVLTRKMCFTTLFPIGTLVLLFSLLFLGDTKFQLHGFIFASFFIVGALTYVSTIRYVLIRAKKRELKEFMSNINGHIVDIKPVI